MKLFQLITVCIYSLASLISFGSITNAASSKWQDLGGGKGRIVAMIDPQSNKISGAVEVSLNPGWSTYWRYPGSTGIPPVFDFSQSSGLVVNSVLFTSPQLLETGGARYAGYKESVVFPFEGEMKGNGDATLSLNLIIGVCEEICIPARATMSVTKSELFQSDPEAIRILSLAKLGIPKKMPAKELKVQKRLANETTMEILIDYDSGEKAQQLFVEGPKEWYLTPAKRVSGNASSHVFHLDVSQVPAGTDILSSKLRYTLAIGRSGVEFEY